MIKNYLLISFRNLRKHFGYSLINITGLGLGLAICLLLVMWIIHELSYDKFHEKSDRIYRVSLEYSIGGQTSRTAVSPTALLPALLDLPETETAVRVYNPSSSNAYVVQKGGQIFQEFRFYLADSSFFNVFSYSLIQGNPNNALTEPYSVVLTKSKAKKYFGNEDPLGKVLRLNNTQDYVVTGVMEDAPTNSFLQFDFIGSFNSIPAGREEPSWWSANYQTFVVPAQNVNITDLKNSLVKVIETTPDTQTQNEGDYVKYNFMLLKDIHLKSKYTTEPEVVSDIKYVYIFSAIALLILLIACINYINLSTARAADRAKEVGLRKVVGALRNQLFIQFISESIILTLISFILAYFVAIVILPFFNSFTGKDFAYTLLLQPQFLFISFLALLIVAILAGAYPAFAITSFKPVSVLKGNFKTSSKGIWLRKALVIVQFSISIILIVGTIVITKQLDYIQSKKLGFERNNIIILPLDKETKKLYEPLKTELIRTGAVQSVARGSESPSVVRGGYSVSQEGKSSSGIYITGLVVDDNYIPTLGMKLITGRNFTKSDVSLVEQDTIHSFILNEAALKELFIPTEEAVGTRLNMNGRKGEIIGVVDNFHFSSLHNPIGPLVMFTEPWQMNKVILKIAAGDITERLEQIKSIYNKILSHRPFEYEFLDVQYNALYEGEQRMSKLFVVFATLAVIIASLGLLGLVSFTASQKTKEIGIRKVLGATSSSIVVLITKDFTKLVIFSIIVGSPAAYWLMEQWLSNFAFKTSIGGWPVLIASVFAFFVAVATSAFQAIKASLINPAESLRSD